MSKVFCIDVAKCNGCYNCQLACKDEHVGNDWAPYAKPQPEIGQFWCKLQENVGGTIPKVKIHYISQLCKPLRERDLYGRLPRRRHLPPRRRTRHYRSRRSAPAAANAWTRARTTRSSSTRR